MSEMPRIWWSPSKGWFGEVGRETFAFAPDYDGPGELPGDARRLTVAAEEAAIASCPGRELEPNPCRCPCYGCKHHCSAHDPADVVELTVTAGDVRRIAEVLLDVLPQVYGYRLGDEPANLDGALGRDAEKVAARLRSAGDGAADVDEPRQCGVPTGPGELCGDPVSGCDTRCEFHIRHALRVELEEAKAEVARLRSAGDGAADVERLRGIERAAAAYIRSCLCNGGTEAPELVADIQEKWAALHDALGADR